LHDFAYSGFIHNFESVHPAYNLSFSACFSAGIVFSLTTNQPTVFFSRLISPTERAFVRKKNAIHISFSVLSALQCAIELYFDHRK
jgi:hypothetical protein